MERRLDAVWLIVVESGIGAGGGKERVEPEYRVVVSETGEEGLIRCPFDGRPTR